MTSQARSEREHVFLAFRRVFAGKNSRIRNRKAIRNVLKHYNWSSHEISIADSSVDVIPIIQGLLKDSIFESKRHAKREFPQLHARPFPNNQLPNRVRTTDMEVDGSENHSMSLEAHIKIEHQESNNFHNPI